MIAFLSGRVRGRARVCSPTPPRFRRRAPAAAPLLLFALLWVQQTWNSTTSISQREQPLTLTSGLHARTSGPTRVLPPKALAIDAQLAASLLSLVSAQCFPRDRHCRSQLTHERGARERRDEPRRRACVTTGRCFSTITCSGAASSRDERLATGSSAAAAAPALPTIITIPRTTTSGFTTATAATAASRRAASPTLSPTRPTRPQPGRAHCRSPAAPAPPTAPAAAPATAAP